MKNLTKRSEAIDKINKILFTEDEKNEKLPPQAKILLLVETVIEIGDIVKKILEEENKEWIFINRNI